MFKKIFKVNSLRVKLMACFILLTFVPLFGYVFYSISVSENALSKQFKAQTQQLLSSNLDEVLDAQKSVVVELSHNPVIKSMDYTVAEPYFQRFVKDNPQYSHLLICDPDGTEVAHSEGAEHHGKNIADREYFHVPWETGKPVIADATFSRSTGRKIIGLGVPILGDNGEKLGVLVGFIRLEYISDRVTSKKVSDSGYTFMINKKGEYISHPDANKLLQENALEEKNNGSRYQALIEKMLAGQTGIEEVTVNGQEMIVNYKPAGINDWSIAMVSPAQEVFALANKMKIDTFKAVALIGLFVVVMALLITNYIMRPIKGYLQMIEHRDFTQRVKSSDELGLAMDKMAVELRSLLSNISGKVETLSSAAERFREISEHSASAANEVSNSIQQITSSSQTQEMKINDIASFIGKLNKQLFDIRDDLEKTRDTSESAYHAAQNGQQLVQHMAQSVEDLSKKAQQINVIVETIGNIAGQTNLLALNAAIEAARAGEQGRGFAVVAEEVRKLAAQSAEATTEIDNLLSEITTRIEEVVDVATGNSGSGNVVSAFTEILEKNQVVSDGVSQVASNARLIQQEGENIKAESVEVVEIVAAATENAENIAASTEEQAATVEELSSSAEELSKVAADMQQEISRFKY